MEDRPSLQAGPAAGIVERAKAILLQPKAEWPRIAGETSSPTSILTGYALPLIAIGPIATLIGSQLFPTSFLGVTYSLGFGFALSTAIASFVFSIIGLFVVAFVANFLSPKFGGKDDWPAAFRLVAYSMTAAWVVGIVGLIPALGILGLLALYSLYLFYLGATPVMGVPQDKSLGYTAITVVAAIVVQIVVGTIAAAMTGAFGFAAGPNIAQETATVDMGELGKVEINGDTATLTVDGQEVEVTIPEEQ
jgi:hypothetical protein